jgi:small conductance mechanosensitive channel
MDLTLNPQHLNHFADIAWAWTITFFPRLAASFGILIIGAIVARWASRGALGMVGRHVDNTVKPILASIVQYAILILVIVVALSQIGVQTASLLAVLGAAGLAIGLALQGTLSNIAAGIMLLWLRPFRAGDFIEVGGMSGTVREVGLFVCQLETFDGIFLFAPNSAIWNSALKNHTRNERRLASINITTSSQADFGRVREILLATAAADSRILTDPPPRVFVDSLAAGTLVSNLRVWVLPQEIGQVQRTIVEDVKLKLEGAGIDTLQLQQVLRVVPPDSDPSRLMADPWPQSGD